MIFLYRVMPCIDSISPLNSSDSLPISSLVATTIRLERSTSSVLNEWISLMIALTGLTMERAIQKVKIARSRVAMPSTVTPLTMPNHRTIKGSTLRMILTQAGIARDEFLDAYEEQ